MEEDQFTREELRLIFKALALFEGVLISTDDLVAYNKVAKLRNKTYSEIEVIEKAMIDG